MEYQTLRLFWDDDINYSFVILPWVFGFGCRVLTEFLVRSRIFLETAGQFSCSSVDAFIDHVCHDV